MTFPTLGATAYLALALFASAALNVKQFADGRVTHAVDSAHVDTAVVANRSQDVAVAALQDSNAACYAGRVFDRAAADMAATKAAAARVTVDRDHDAAVAKLAHLLAGQCSDWAAQPACGVRP